MKFRKLYALYSWSLLWRCKIGISYDVQQRIQQLEYELSGAMNQPVRVQKAVAVPVLFPEKMEGWLHGKLAALNARVPYHRGHTEWFQVRNFGGALCLLLCAEYMGLDWEWWHLAAVYFLPLPIDAALLVVGVLVAQIAAVFFLLYLLLFGFAAGLTFGV